MRRLALTSAASSSPPQQALTRFARNRPVHGNAGAHNWKPSGALLSQRSEETQHCCGSDVGSVLEHLHGITLGKHPLAFGRCQLKNSLWFVPFEPKVYLISHISQCCYISSSLPTPVPLTRTRNYRVADCVESFCLNVSQNHSDSGSVSQSVPQHCRNCLRIARLVAGFPRSDPSIPGGSVSGLERSFFLPDDDCAREAVGLLLRAAQPVNR